VRGDKVVVNEIDMLRNDVKDLQNENQQLRNDLRESTNLLKDYQEQDTKERLAQKQTRVEEEKREEEWKEKMKELEGENAKIREEYERASALRAAFNADRSAFQERIAELEQQVK